MVVNALELLLKQKRFDLIFKYVFLAQQNEFAHNAYLENIRAFNNFYELNPSDGVPKNSADDFVQSFNNLIQNIKDNAPGRFNLERNRQFAGFPNRRISINLPRLSIKLQQGFPTNDQRSFRRLIH